MRRNCGPAPALGRNVLFYVLPLCLFVLAATAIYPYYQYRIGADDISYLAITSRYLKGDYATAVNAYWSPLNIWLLVLLIKISGWPILFASYFLNCLSFSGLLLLSIKLAIKFINSRFEIIGLGICLALFWAANIPVTHFADALNNFLLLACLLLILHRNFLQKTALWVLLGLLSAIAYFSKAYSFYILPLSLAIIVFIFLKNKEIFSLKKWLSVLLVTTGSMIFFSLPWILIIYNKYHIWAVSTAGSINTNWAIRGYMYFSNQYPILVPPAYPDALTCWEDVWIHKGEMLSPLGSPSLFLKQLFRMSMNVLQWFKVTAEFSPLYFPVWLLGLLYLLRKKIKDYNPARSALFVSFLIFPAGYLMLSFGTRYLWYTVPLVMLSGLLFFRQYLLPALQTKVYRIFLVIYFISWLPGSILELKDTLNEGKSDFLIAQKLEDLHIKGSFITNNYEESYFRISWFTGNSFYIHFDNNWTTVQLIDAAKKQKVNYYYYFYNRSNNDYTLNDASGKPYPEMTLGKIPGLKVFQLK